MAAAGALKSDMLAALPALRAYALSLSGRPDRADDLVQDTIMRAWENSASFAEGTNLRAWLFTILRNQFYSDCRKRRREVEDADGAYADGLRSLPEQDGHLDFKDFRKALTRLPPDQREALILIGGSGMSYEEAAGLCGCAIGTMKSRVNRARRRLVESMHVASGAEFGPDAAFL